MARQVAAAEPAFGSDSFLDVTANLVGVLIILIVLVGLRVSQAPPEIFARDTAQKRRMAVVQEELANLKRRGSWLSQRAAALDQAMEAKQSTLSRLESQQRDLTGSANQWSEQKGRQRLELEQQNQELDRARLRLVGLEQELDQAKANMLPPRELVYRSPLSRPVEADEIHFELQAGRVSFVDLQGLLNRAKSKGRSMEAELRSRGRATGEAGPVAGFRLLFTMAREEMPFTQSLLYGNNSLRARLVEWEVLPTRELRGEPAASALRDGSLFDTVLARHSPSDYAVTIWTYPDSFAAYRQLRDHLHERGYAVAARPLPLGSTIRGSVLGSRSFAQ
jgi:hypothetical protein